MKSSPFRSVVLPAMLVSSTVFAVLTLPIASERTTRLTNQLPPAVSQWIPPVFGQQHKEFSIRYIGFAIMASVAVGVGAAESLRWQRSKAQGQNLSLNQALTAEDPGSLETSQHPLTIDEPAFSLLNTTPAPAFQSEANLATPSEDLSSALPQTDLNFDWEALAQASATADGALLAVQDCDQPILPTHNYRTCRIQGTNQQTLLAVVVEGDYYSFYRRRPTVEKAKAVVGQLKRRGKQAMITADEQGYLIWRHQPQAVPADFVWEGSSALDFNPEGI